MKNKLYLFLGIVGLLFCVAFQNKPQPNDTETNSVQADCNSMVNFMKATLYENYGDSLAFDRFLTSYFKYDGNYLLKVNKEELMKHCKQLYADTWFSYFVLRREWDSFDEYYRTERAMDTVLILKDERGYSKRTFSKKEDEYLTSRYKCFTPIECLYDAGSYVTENLGKSKHPFLKQQHKNIRYSGVLSSMTINHFNNYHIGTDFRAGDKDVQLFVSFYLWQYLCYCANVDVFTGKPKEQTLLIDN